MKLRVCGGRRVCPRVVLGIGAPACPTERAARRARSLSAPFLSALPGDWARAWGDVCVRAANGLINRGAQNNARLFLRPLSGGLPRGRRRNRPLLSRDGEAAAFYSRGRPSLAAARTTYSPASAHCRVAARSVDRHPNETPRESWVVGADELLCLIRVLKSCLGGVCG